MKILKKTALWLMSLALCLILSLGIIALINFKAEMVKMAQCIRQNQAYQ